MLILRFVAHTVPSYYSRNKIVKLPKVIQNIFLTITTSRYFDKLEPHISYICTLSKHSPIFFW